MELRPININEVPLERGVWNELVKKFDRSNMDAAEVVDYGDRKPKTVFFLLKNSRSRFKLDDKIGVVCSEDRVYLYKKKAIK